MEFYCGVATCLTSLNANVEAAASETKKKLCRQQGEVFAIKLWDRVISQSHQILCAPSQRGSR